MVLSEDIAMRATVIKLPDAPILVVTLSQSIIDLHHQSEFYAVANRLSELISKHTGPIMVIVDVRCADLRSGERIIALLETLRVGARYRFSIDAAFVVNQPAFDAASSMMPLYNSVESALEMAHYRPATATTSTRAIIIREQAFSASPITPTHTRRRSIHAPAPPASMATKLIGSRHNSTRATIIGTGLFSAMIQSAAPEADTAPRRNRTISAVRLAVPTIIDAILVHLPTVDSRGKSSGASDDRYSIHIE
jgi:hypothetical protein